MKDILSLTEELKLHGKSKTYDQKQVFVREGEIPNKIGIIKTGLFRYYYLTDDGKEFTKVFMKEGDIISSYISMISGKASHYTIEAIEKSELIEISYHQWKRLRNSGPQWDKLLISLLEKGYGVKEKRERDLLLLDAETRYLNFLEEFPDLDKRVNLNLIASFLGIQPESLSRIRKKILT